MMKKFFGWLITLAVIVLIVLWLTGRLGSAPETINTDTVADDTAVVAEATGDVVDEITAEDLDMIEDFLDEIVEAVEKEEVTQ